MTYIFNILYIRTFEWPYPRTMEKEEWEIQKAEI